MNFSGSFHWFLYAISDKILRVAKIFSQGGSSDLFPKFLVHTQNNISYTYFNFCVNLTKIFVKDAGCFGSLLLLVRNILILLLFFSFSGVFGNNFVIHPFIAPSPYHLRFERKVSLYIDYHPSRSTCNDMVPFWRFF